MSNGDHGTRWAGFLQFNLGHLITIISILLTLGAMYSKLSTTLDNHGTAILNLQETTARLEADQTQMAIADASEAKDLADMHRNIEEDLARRVTKIEDRIDTGPH
jgi:hypothetical protein